MMAIIHSDDRLFTKSIKMRENLMELDIDLDAIETKILEGDYPDWDIVLSIIDELRELKKGKTMSEIKMPKSLGTYEFERSTARFHVYTQTNEDGVKESQYVFKKHFNDKPPRRLEFFIKWAE